MRISISVTCSVKKLPLMQIQRTGHLASGRLSVSAATTGTDFYQPVGSDCMFPSSCLNVPHTFRRMVCERAKCHVLSRSLRDLATASTWFSASTSFANGKPQENKAVETCRPEAAATGSKGRHPKQMPWPSVQVPMAQGSRASAKFCKRSSSKVSPNTQRELPGKGRRSIPMVETWRHHLVASKNEQILSLTQYTCHSDICPLAYASFCKKSSSLRRGAALADMDS